MTATSTRPPLHKRAAAGPPPNMPEYGRARAEFSWAQARSRLAGLPHGRLNIAYEAVDRQAESPAGGAMAVRFLSKHRPPSELAYGDLKRSTDRFANLLDDLGVQPGERVFALAGRIPELYITALGTLKHGSVFCPLFSAFGPEPIEQRLALGDARVLVTTAALYRRKVAELRGRLPGLTHVLVVGRREEPSRLTSSQGGEWCSASRGRRDVPPRRAQRPRCP